MNRNATVKIADGDDDIEPPAIENLDETPAVIKIRPRLNINWVDWLTQWLIDLLKMIKPQSINITDNLFINSLLWNKIDFAIFL